MNPIQTLYTGKNEDVVKKLVQYNTWPIYSYVRLTMFTILQSASQYSSYGLLQIDKEENLKHRVTMDEESGGVVQNLIHCMP